jgi:hypothetical protein
MQGGFADPLSQRIFDDLENVDTSSHVWTVVYLNGDFWGVYAIREHYNDRYISDHYGINRNNVAMLSFNHGDDSNSGIPRIQEGPFADHNDLWMMQNYWEMYEFARTNTTFTDSILAEFETKYMNVDGLIDSMLAYMLSGNADWPNNNMRIWRPVTPVTGHGANPKLDGRWNFVLHDFDMGFGGAFEGGYSAAMSRNLIDHLLGVGNGSTWGAPNSAWGTLWFRRCMTNENFRSRVLERMMYITNTLLDNDRFNAVVDSFVAELAPMRAVNASRWKFNKPLSGGSLTTITASSSWEAIYKASNRDYKANIYNWTRNRLRANHQMTTSSAARGPQLNTVTGRYSGVNGVFDSDRSIVIPAHNTDLNYTRVRLVTDVAANANATTFKYGYSVPAASSNMPDTFRPTSISVFPDNKLQKDLFFFNNMHIVLQNDHPDFLRYEISINGTAGPFVNFTDRNHTFRTSASMGTGVIQTIIRTVYA